MKGVILDITPEAQIVDISHAVQAFDVLDGALAISQSYSYFPNGTVHVVVVDPGVGTTRRPILASSDGYHFVAPDNGVLSMVYAKEERMHVRHITSDHYFRQPVSNTFHARDIFAPVAAYLAKLVDSHKFGDEIEDYVRFAAPRPKATGEDRMRAVVLKVDRFGNLITNRDAARCSGGVRGVREIQDRGGKQRDYGNPQGLCRGRAGRSLRHCRQHGIPRDCGQPRGGSAAHWRRQGQRSQHLPGRSCGGGQRGLGLYRRHLAGCRKSLP